MSLPAFSTQSFLFSTAALAGSVFPEPDRDPVFHPTTLVNFRRRLLDHQ